MLGLRFNIRIYDDVTGDLVVNRWCDSFNFVVHHRRRSDLPTHEISAVEYEYPNSDISSSSEEQI